MPNVALINVYSDSEQFFIFYSKHIDKIFS